MVTQQGPCLLLPQDAPPHHIHVITYMIEVFNKVIWILQEYLCCLMDWEMLLPQHHLQALPFHLPHLLLHFKDHLEHHQCQDQVMLLRDPQALPLLTSPQELHLYFTHPYPFHTLYSLKTLLHQEDVQPHHHHPSLQDLMKPLSDLALHLNPYHLNPYGLSDHWELLRPLQSHQKFLLHHQNPLKVLFLQVLKIQRHL